VFLVKWVDEHHRKMPLARDGSAINYGEAANKLRALNHRKVQHSDLKTCMRKSENKQKRERLAQSHLKRTEK
jgi:hypothetical protein